MNEITSVPFILMTLVCAFSWITVAYEGVANTKGWVVGRWFSGTSPLVIVCILSLLTTAGLAFYIDPWWSPIAALILGNVLSRLIFMFFQPYSQLLGIAGLIASVIAVAYYYPLFSQPSINLTPLQRCIDDASKRPTAIGVRAAASICHQRYQQTKPTTEDGPWNRYK